MADTQIKNIVLFASGSGSNAQRILEYFQNHPTIRVAALFSNNPEAYALKRAENFNVPAITFTRPEFKDGTVLEKLKKFNPELIVLAGFLWLMPEGIVREFPDKIINIHPALLPKFGGKGMYGNYVHAAVVAAQEAESGITIHYVNEKFDEGEAILQERCPVRPGDTPEEVAARVLELEHKYFAPTIEKLLNN
ncbi:MAG TPA: phosphoribosylglycinamide formyltransferase [Adhaeribacter sp.]|nr:phosphoribosylglycinamide formyltransferase [Adhaeribacter sp.]